MIRYALLLLPCAALADPTLYVQGGMGYQIGMAERWTATATGSSRASTSAVWRRARTTDSTSSAPVTGGNLSFRRSQ